uniref:Phospholipase A2 isogeny 3 n=1 Tax=Cajanus cajan TaxID=3821 RepID=A0A151TKH5_CAJCA|nr:Phospholipase A2 isogeny 3 [Cajanus cajan]
MIPSQLSKCALLFISCTFVINFLNIPVSALNISVEIETPGINVSMSIECSRKCESSFFSATMPPSLGYDNYCGLPYDGLDALCMIHDKCVQVNKSEFNKSLNVDFLIQTFYIMAGILDLI